MNWPFCYGNEYSADCMVYKTNTTYLSETNSSYIPFTHMYIKNRTDLTASVPPEFDNWLNSKSDGFLIRSIEEYFLRMRPQVMSILSTSMKDHMNEFGPVFENKNCYDYMNKKLNNEFPTSNSTIGW